MWDEEDEGKLTCVSEVTRAGGGGMPVVKRGVADSSNGVAPVEVEESETDSDIDEVELLQLRNLVQRIKLQTVVGAKFMKAESLPQDPPVTNNLVKPVSSDVMEMRFSQLQRENCLLLQEREELRETVDVMQKELEKRGTHGGGEFEKMKDEVEKVKQELREAKREVEEMKNSREQLRIYYQEKTEGTHSGADVGDGGVVSLDDYNKLKELHFSVNLLCSEKSEKNTRLQEELKLAKRDISAMDQQLTNMRMSLYCRPNRYGPGNHGDPPQPAQGDGLLPLPVPCPTDPANSLFYKAVPPPDCLLPRRTR